MLSGVLRHERNFGAALAVLDSSIQFHSNTASELLALYGKINLAITVLNDTNLAQSTFQILKGRYADHSLTRTADVLVNNGGQAQLRLNPSQSAVASTDASLSVEKPLTLALWHNHPNPFNPTTTIAYQVPRQSEVRIEIYSMLGQKVRTLLNDRKEPGEYKAVWDGRNDGGAQVASGVYMYRMVAGDFMQVRKMILMR